MNTAPAAPPAGGGERLPGLDGLRAVSVLAVIAYHLDAGGQLPAWAHPVAKHGMSGVGVFFVISGFIITWLMLKEEGRHGRVSLKGFYFRRTMRILPPAWGYLGFVALLAALRPGAYPGLDAWADFGAAFLFVRNLTQAAGSDVTRHFWSLSIEEQFYLLWPVLFVLCPARWRFWATAGLCLAAPVWRQVNMELFGAGNLNWFRADLRFDQLLIGAAFAMARHERRFPWLLEAGGRRAGTLLALAALCYGGGLALGGAVPGFLRPAVGTLGLAATGLVIHLTSAGQGGWFLRLLSLGPVVWTGRLSYSLYLWQQLFCGIHTGAAWERPPQNVVLTFVAAAASYYGLEQPALRLRARLQERWRRDGAAKRRLRGADAAR